MSAEVLVVGAGPTGLVLALALTRAGVATRIIDRRADIRPESRALDVQARTLELYRQLGVADRVVQAGVRVEQVSVRVGGRVVSTTDVRDVGLGLSPYPFLLCCPQDVHETILVEELAALGVTVERQTELVTLRDTGACVEAVLELPDGRSEETSVGYVCGCDGAGSTVREQAGIAFPGATSGQSFFVADVVATSDVPHSPLAHGAFCFCLSGDDFLLVVPARRGGTHRLIGLVPAGLTGVPDLTFEPLRETVQQAAGVRVDIVNWFSTYRVSHRVADRFRSGRAFVLGDAGHVHSPLGGQGMNTGIADAVNLAWKLAAVLAGRAEGSLLDSYERERIGFARSLVATTDRAFGLVAGAGRGHRLGRVLLFRWLLPVALRWPRPRRAMIGRISQVHLNYRGHGSSRGRAGRVRGGDRLPWVDFGDGRDNFEPLTTLDWQVHVYGTASADLRRTAERAGLAVCEFAWNPAVRAAGLRRDALYLVRPDGYLALVDRRQDTGRLLAALEPPA